jgi:TolA-binding protein
VGSALLARKEFQSAAECLNRAAWLEPRSTETMMHLARLQLETGQTNNAIGILDGVLKLKPGHPVAKRLKESLK